MEGQKEQALIRRRVLCAASDQSLDFLSHMSICRKHFYRFYHILKTINEYK